MKRLLLAAALVAAASACAPATPQRPVMGGWIDDGDGLSHRNVTPVTVCYRQGAALSCVRNP